MEETAGSLGAGIITDITAFNCKPEKLFRKELWDDVKDKLKKLTGLFLRLTTPSNATKSS